MCPESQLFLKKILPNFRIFLSQIFVQIAEKIFCANCRKKFLYKLPKKIFVQIAQKKFCPILGYFDLKFLCNLPIDKTRWLWYNGKTRWLGRQRTAHKKDEDYSSSSSSSHKGCSSWHLTMVSSVSSLI